MIDLDNIEELIIQEKNNLKKKSKNYKKNFLEGNSPPDFAAENYEVTYK